MGDRDRCACETCEIKIAALDVRSNQHIVSVERLLRTEIVSLKEAFATDKGVQDARLGKMNEVREQLDRQANTFVIDKANTADLNAIRDRLWKLERWPWLFSLFGGVIGAIIGSVVAIALTRLLR